MDKDKKISPYNYWKIRCEAAEAYISLRSMIPDTNQGQDAARENWQMIVDIREQINPVEPPVEPLY